MTHRAAVRIALLAVAGGILFELVAPGRAAGVNAVVLVGALLAAAHLVAGLDGLRRTDPADAWLAPAALGFAALVAVRADPWLVAADVVFAATLAAGSIASLGGARITRGAVPAVLALAADLVAAVLLGGARVLERARPIRGPGSPRRHLPRRVAPVARGIVLAAPLVAVFALLFAAADAVFASVAGRVLDLRLDLDLAEAGRITFDVGVVAWVSAGLLTVAAVARPAGVPAAASGASDPVLEARGAIPGWRAADPAAVPARTFGERRHVGTVEATTILVVLDLLFGAFVALQVAYLFGGRDTLAGAGLTYAEYARRGFFELVAVAALAVLVAAALDLAAVRRSRLQAAASLLLLGLTAVVLVSAFERLRLYQAAYGWTELRLVVLASIGWLAAALLATGILLARRRTAWLLHVLGILLLVGVVGLNLVGPQAFVAERNLERALDPSLVAPGGRPGLDADYIAALGDEAVPAVLAVVDRLQVADRAALEAFLAWRRAELVSNPALTGWPSWNAARERARQALESQRG